MHRTLEFGRRSVLYARLDCELYDFTRFFAAAALINAVMAELFRAFAPIRFQRTFVFIDEVGAALEQSNLRYASEISLRTPSRALDGTLVRAEQMLLQRHVHAHQARCPRQWESVRGELNALLNERYAAALVSRWCKASGRLSRVLREVRGRLGTGLDFATESHRVHIGLALIEHIRRSS